MPRTARVRLAGGVSHVVSRFARGVVSYHYGQAMTTPAELDEPARTLTALLSGRRRPRPRTKTKATADALPVRYHVDVQET